MANLLSAQSSARLAVAAERLIDAVAGAHRGDDAEVRVEVLRCLGKTIADIDSTLAILGSSRAEALAAAEEVAEEMARDEAGSLDYWMRAYVQLDPAARQDYVAVAPRPADEAKEEPK